MFKFSPEIVAKYQDTEPAWGPVGAVVYKRTYSRPIYENGKITGRENWLDTCVRVIEGSMNLISNDPTATPEWAEKALDSMFHMAWLPPGRGLWMLGTEYAKYRGGDALNNCFRKGTLVHTEDGVFPIEELVGKTVKVLSKDGIYRKADFKSYGEQELLKMTLSTGEEIYSTANHQWVLYDEKTKSIKESRTFTKDLKKSHRLPVVTPNCPKITPDEKGIAHGFVYGDGTINTYKVANGTKSYGLVRFPNKIKMDAIFDLICKYGTDKEHWQIPAVIHLPVEWKSVPENTTKEYALGFILGLITADGYVRGSISIHQADEVNLEKIRRLAMWVGLKTSPIRIDREISPYTKEYSPMYVFTISTASLHKDLLIREDQKRKWECKQGHINYTTSVRSVESTGIVEEVYCCTEMETHTMVVGTGVLTGQCWFVAVKPQIYGDMPMFEGVELIYSTNNNPEPSFPFCFMFDRAMLGGGIGFGVQHSQINQFPMVDTKVNLSVILSSDHPDWMRIASSEDFVEMRDFVTMTPDEEAIVLQDSREGWVVAIRELIDAHWCNCGEIDIAIDVSNIRSYGAEIKGFGGTASGPLALMSALCSINKVLNTRVFKNLQSVDALDIMNLLARCVVSGNVRRTALIAIGDASDKQYVNAKNYTLTDAITEKENGFTKWAKNDFGKMSPVLKDAQKCIEELGEEVYSELSHTLWCQQNHRWASNNSVMITELFDDFHFITAGIIANGEPGIGNEWLIKNFGRIKDGYQHLIDGDAEGLNPCAEITLANAEPCNLVEVIPQRILELGYDPYEILKIATQYSYRITFAKYSWKATQDIIEKNRRIGVSLTGEQDYFLSKYNSYAVLGFRDKDQTEPIYHRGILDELCSWYNHVNQVNKNHALSLGAKASIKLTTMKPSGTVAKLPGVSSGIHFHYAPYLIQRIRFNDADPNLKVMEMCGYPILPDHQSPNTMVVEFPVKAANADHPNFKCAGDVSLAEQFANQALFAYAWADNAVSATLTFQQNEVDKIEPLLKAYKNRLKSTSLLPYSGHGYLLAPWEPIDKAEYERRIAQVKTNMTDAYRSVSLVEEMGEIIEDECAKGSCPIR